MLKGEDIALLLKLAVDPRDDWTVRALEADTRIPRSAIHRSLQRLDDAGLADGERRRARLAQAEEFLLHGMRYVFPGTLGGETRGIPAAWGAAPLVAQIDGGSAPPPVWPHAYGPVRGPALEPLHWGVVNAALTDPRLGEGLALLDALRAGDARVRGVAAEMLSSRLGTVATP